MTANPEYRLRTDLTRFSRRLYDRGLITAQDGNLSARISEGEFLITPSGIDKAALDPADILRIDATGRILRGLGAVSMETAMHLSVYAERPDVQAVIHAHPPTAIAFTLAGQPLRSDALPEALAAFGEIGCVGYALPGSEELAAAVRTPIRAHDALTLDRHGAVTVGRDLFDAFTKMERLEFVALVTLRARLLGPIEPLAEEEKARLLEFRARLARRI